MLRIKGASKEAAPKEVQDVFAAQERQYGTILNTAKVYGLRPTIQQGVQALQAGIVASGLIGARAASPFVHEGRQYQRLPVLTGHQRIQWDATRGFGGKGRGGVGRYKKNSLFTLREKLALELCERMTYTGQTGHRSVFQSAQKTIFRRRTRRVGGGDCTGEFSQQVQSGVRRGGAWLLPGAVGQRSCRRGREQVSRVSDDDQAVAIEKIMCSPRRGRSRRPENCSCETFLIFFENSLCRKILATKWTEVPSYRRTPVSIPSSPRCRPTPA